MSNTRQRYPQEIRERAVRLVAEVRDQYDSEWAAIESVATKLGIGSTETLRKWIRKAEVDAGHRPGVSCGPRCVSCGAPMRSSRPERTQRRGCVGAGEDPAHPAVAEKSHVVDAVRAGNHPRDQGSDLQPGVGTLVCRDAEMRIGQLVQPGRTRQRKHRNQPDGRHEVRVVEHRRGRPRSVAKLHLRDALPAGEIGTLEKSDFPSR